MTKYLSIDIGPWPITLSRRRSSLPWRRNQYQPTWAPIKYLQQMSGTPRYLSGPDHLSRQTSRLFLTLPIDSMANWFICNCHRDYLRYCQPTPGLLNLSSWLLRVRLKYWFLLFLVPLTCLSEALLTCILKITFVYLFTSFHGHVDCGPS